MARTTPTAQPDTELVDQKALETALGISRWMVADRISRYPLGTKNAFPVEYVGRWRRFNIQQVRDWFAAERRGFDNAQSA